MLHKFSVPIATAALLLGAVACGSSSSSTTAGSSASGPSGDPLTVAVVLPLTGASAKTAEQMSNAAKLAIDEVNAAGGVAGHPLEGKTYDDALKPENAASEAQRAITRDRAIAVIGAQSSGEALAIRELAERAQVPFITSSATVEAVTTNAKYTYRIAPLLTDYANGVVDIGKSIGLKKPAVLNDSGGAGVLLKKLFLARAKTDGVTFAGDPIEYPLNGTDVSAQVAAAAALNPDGVLIGGSAGGDHGLVAKTMVEQGLKVPLIGFSPILVSDAIKIGGEAYGKLPAVYSLQNVDQNKTQFKDFKQKYIAKYGDADLTEQPAQTFDAVMVLADALKKSDGKGGDALRGALNQTQDYQGASGREGAKITFSADRHDAFSGKYLVAYKLNGPKAVQADLNF